jgi:hypothetical protein
MGMRRQTVTKPAPVGGDHHWRSSPETQIPRREPDPVEGFRATVMELVLKYRALDGRNVFDPFAAAVNAERERYQRKGLPLDVMRQIDGVADRAIVRARAYGITAFEPGNN